MIALQNLSLGYGSRLLLDKVSTRFGAGSITALIGRNGAGKSTLLRTLTGSSEPLAGDMLLNGTALREITPRELARTVALVTTERVRIANLSCRDVTALGRTPYTNWIGRMQPEDEKVVMRSLERVGMGEYASRTLDKMSDGECQRVMIARALAQETPIILLDEPTSFLDMPNRYELCRLLADLAHHEGKCILFSTHELDIALSVCDSIALIDTPHLHHLPTQEMVRQGHIERLFSLQDPTFSPGTEPTTYTKRNA